MKFLKRTNPVLIALSVLASACTATTQVAQEIDLEIARQVCTEVFLPIDDTTSPQTRGHNAAHAAYCEGTDE